MHSFELPPYAVNNKVIMFEKSKHRLSKSCTSLGYNPQGDGNGANDATRASQPGNPDDVISKLTALNLNTAPALSFTPTSPLSFMTLPTPFTFPTSPSSTSAPSPGPVRLTQSRDGAGTPRRLASSRDALATVNTPPIPPTVTIPKTLPPADDDVDPFDGFEELDDSSLASLATSSSAKFEIKTTTTFTTHAQGFDIETKLDHVRVMTSSTTTATSSAQGKVDQFFSKFTEHEDDWDHGVDMEVEAFVSRTEYSYVNNKIMEIASVKEEAMRSKDKLLDNPKVVEALHAVLSAKQIQIQRALDKDKINKQDHSKLLERLNQVRDMLSHPKSGTW